MFWGRLWLGEEKLGHFVTTGKIEGKTHKVKTSREDVGWARKSWVLGVGQTDADIILFEFYQVWGGRCVCVCVYVCIQKERERQTERAREREREGDVNLLK